MSTTTDDRRAAARERVDRLQAKARELSSEHAAAAKAKAGKLDDAARAKVELLQTQRKSVEHALTAELAEDKQAFIDAMQGYVDDVKALSDKLSQRATTMTGAARERIDAAIADVRRGRDTVAERMAQVREQSGDRWRETKESVAAERAELERKADDALKKLK